MCALATALQTPPPGAILDALRHPLLAENGFNNIDPATGAIIADLVQRLRPYQSKALRISKEQFDAGVRRQMVVMPTGCGKTILFSVLHHFLAFKKRILVLVHRDTLAQQAREKILAWNPDFTVGIEEGAYRSNGTERVVVASVQTIGRPIEIAHDGKTRLYPCRRLLKFNPEDFDAVIVDECHHATATGYKMVFRHFGFLNEHFKKTKPAPKRLLLGVTATPKRFDGERLDTVFDKKIYEYGIDVAIREGWLSDIRAYAIRTKVLLENIKSVGDDLDRGALGKAVNTPARNQLVVDWWQKLSGTRPSICFAVNVQHTRDLCKEFTDRGIKAAAVWGKDPEKAAKVAQFGKGELQVLVSCDLLTEGYDESRVACVVLARPTASETLFKQMIGRGTRLEAGVSNILDALAHGKKLTKPDCIVLDFQDNTAQHSLVVDFTGAYGLPPRLNLRGHSLLHAADTFENIKRREKRNGADPDGRKLKSFESMEQYEQELLESNAEEIDLLAVRFDYEVLEHSELQWHKIAPEYYVLILPNKMGKIFLYRNIDGHHVLDGQLLADDKAFLVIGERKNAEFWQGFAYADRKVRQVVGPRTFDLLNRNSDATWLAEPATEKQAAALKRYFESHGQLPPANMTKGEASKLIRKLQAMHERVQHIVAAAAASANA
jgi:superfamily II DNA or RNA helicase